MTPDTITINPEPTMPERPASRINQCQHDWVSAKAARDAAVADCRRPFDEVLANLYARRDTAKRALSYLNEEITRYERDRKAAIADVRTIYADRVNAAYKALQDEALRLAEIHADKSACTWNDARRYACLLKSFATDMGYEQLRMRITADTAAIVSFEHVDNDTEQSAEEAQAE